MPEFEIVCLANSRKHSGRCVAGIRLDGEGWIRPVGWSTEGTLFPHYYLLPDGSEAGLLDVLRITCVKPRPEAHHPENWLLKQKTWTLIARPAPDDIAPLLREHLIKGPAVLGDTLDRVPFRNFQERPAPNSLALVAPDKVHWIVRTKPTGDRQYRVAFSLSGRFYEWPLTDQNWEQRLNSLPPGTHHGQAVGLLPDDRVLFTISLSEPFQKEDMAEPLCYKLVAAVTVVPPAWREILCLSHSSKLSFSLSQPPRETVTTAVVDREAAPVRQTEKGTPACSLEDKRKEPPRADEVWGESEERWLIQLHRAGHSVAQIAMHLQREEGGIRSRLEKLRCAGRLEDR